MYKTKLELILFLSVLVFYSIFLAKYILSCNNILTSVLIGELDQILFKPFILKFDYIIIFL